MPHVQVFGLPRNSGDGRFRASFSVSDCTEVTTLKKRATFLLCELIECSEHKSVHEQKNDPLGIAMAVQCNGDGIVVCQRCARCNVAEKRDSHRIDVSPYVVESTGGGT